MKNTWPLLAVFFLWSCADSNSSPANKEQKVETSATTAKKETAAVDTTNRVMADAATILARKQVPVLCYHHIYDIPKATREYDVTVNEFKRQMKMLHDSGYHAILPDQLYNYLAYGEPLPEKPFMITYDDTDAEQFTIAKPEMDKYGFKGVYFLMAISIGRPRYMTKDQIKQLADEGHAIASHTWDHHRVDRYKYENTIEERGVKKVVNDYEQQLGKTKKSIEAITGKPVQDFAYPFGIWSKEAIPEIRKQGYRMAFQLSTKRDSTEPLYTVRRMIVAPTWTAEGLLRVMKSTFGRD